MEEATQNDVAEAIRAAEEEDDEDDDDIVVADS